jgi:hypothetical protein
MILFMGMYIKFRHSIWIRIIEVERCLSYFHKDLTVDYSSKYTPSKFIEKWTAFSEEDIIRNIDERSNVIINEIITNIDKNNDMKISKNEFEAFAVSKNICEWNEMWDLITNFSEDVYILPSSDLTIDILKEVLYNLDFMRRRFCLMLKTDFVIIHSLMVYIAGVAYGLAFVIIANIVNYTSAFGTGFDLFKVYIFVITYFTSSFKSKLQFLWIMLWCRPYNIGDILLIENSPYQIQEINSGFTRMYGATTIFISNQKLLDDIVQNISGDFVTESLVLSFPVNSDCSIDRLYQVLIDYASSGHEINPKSIQCGWHSVDSFVKNVFCSWKYTILIHDRYRYIKLRLALTNYIIEIFGNEIAVHFMQTQIAQSGAYNNVEKFKILN